MAAAPRRTKDRTSPRASGAGPRSRRLFVYGTLLQGEPGHRLLAGARLVREASTEAAFELVSLGPYPALVPGGATAVHGELYLVPAAQLADLDAYEGHPTFYRRTAIRLAGGGRAEAYLLRPDQAAAYPRIESGRWRDVAPAATAWATRPRPS
ncbi:MAG: gamma-glutamylcyclotransferase family protein [Minicystis sp.]